MPIIANPEYLSENYPPEKLLHRDKKTQLMNSLKPSLSSSPLPLLIHEELEYKLEAY